jgi:acetyltransferase-like isoleucine patch superfamily enzyme
MNRDLSVSKFSAFKRLWLLTRSEGNNCIRGGFVCNGYPSRGQWQKSEQKQVPVPLQSKDGYDTSPNQYQAPPYPQQPPPLQQQSQAKREPLPSYPSRQPLRVDPHQPSARNLGTDDERQSASTLPSASAGSPEKRLSAMTYSQATTFPTPVSASPSNYPDRMNQMDFQRMPPLLDPARNDHDTGTPQSAHSAVPHISILHPSLTNSPHPHTPQSTAAQDAARLALSHPAAASRPRTQKEEMLANRNFFPFDRELVLERERCSAACWRFNNSTNPNNGNLPEDRPRLFRDILQPKEMINMEGQTTSPVSPAGYVGHDVVVTAPFNCDYGYNIQIGQEVNIGKNCTILDAAEVRIGDKTVIGPNVTLCTTTVPIHPAKRNGSKGPQMGKPIIIEQDCLIGAGAIILPGRTVKRGSTVGAGSVVTRVGLSDIGIENILLTKLGRSSFHRGCW